MSSVFFMSRYVGFLEKQLLEKESDIFVVLDRLVQIFLPQKQYHNDNRYINLCIKYVSLGSNWYFSQFFSIQNYIFCLLSPLVYVYSY